MHLKSPTTAHHLATRFQAHLLGNPGTEILGLNEIHHVAPGDLCFVDHPRYYDKTLASPASVILIDREYDCPPGKALLVVDQPFAVYDTLVREERGPTVWGERVDPSVDIGEGVTLAPGATVGAGVHIGAGTYVGPNAVIYDGVRVGANVRIGAGAVIGDEAFYFKRTAEGLRPWRSGGTVILEDDVEIGPNCTVARGVSSPTVIGRGSKLDALVQIGHDCKIGAHCVFAAQVGVAGNTTVGDWVTLQGQVGVIQNITIGDRVTVFGQSGVTKDLAAGKEYFGSPAQEARTAFRDLMTVRRLRDKK